MQELAGITWGQAITLARGKTISPIFVFSWGRFHIAKDGIEPILPAGLCARRTTLSLISLNHLWYCNDLSPHVVVGCWGFSHTQRKTPINGKQAVCQGRKEARACVCVCRPIRVCLRQNTALGHFTSILAPPTLLSFLPDNEPFSKHAVKGRGLGMSMRPIFDTSMLIPWFGLWQSKERERASWVLLENDCLLLVVCLVDR